ncbi:MAG: hypothetical protein HY822_01775 [Acidobacteria bacterium]|nr:hypothetical protein [Acidobacteriota bacterium]
MRPEPRVWLKLARRNSLRAGDLSMRERHLRSALAERDEARRRLLSRLRHDLVGPINTFSGFLELLSEERVGPLNPVQRNYVEHMLHAVGRALELIDAVAARKPDAAGGEVAR